MAGPPECCVDLQKDLNRGWAENCLEFSKSKGRVLHLERINPMYRLGTDLLGSSSEERDLGVLVDKKLSMGQQCVPGDNGVLGSIRKSKSGEVIQPLGSAL